MATAETWQSRGHTLKVNGIQFKKKKNS